MGRVGRKRQDRRWEDPFGEVWASEYEYRIFESIRATFGPDVVSKCSEQQGDSLAYSTKVAGGNCLGCGSGEVVQRRVYTPDIRIVSPSASSGSGFYYIETKGYWPRHSRGLLRGFVSSRPDIDLCVIFQFDKNPKELKGRRYSDYVKSYLPGVDCFTWNSISKAKGAKYPATMPPEFFRHIEKVISGKQGK